MIALMSLLVVWAWLRKESPTEDISVETHMTKAKGTESEKKKNRAE